MLPSLWLAPLLLLALVGCTESDGVEPEPGVAEDAVSYVPGRGVEVTREAYGDDWPFTVDSGYADCVSGAAIFRHGGVDYQLTGLARSMGYEPIDPIWRDNPGSMGSPKVSLGSVTSVALEQCQE